LASLPAETLGEIASKLEGENITLLWLCGSNLLNLKLSEGGGVRSFRIKFRSHQTRHYWPTIVQKFVKLQIFEYNAFNSDKIARFDECQLLQLPASLRALRLSVRGAQTIIYKAFEREPSRFANLERLKLLSSFIIDGDYTPPLNAVLPKNLKHLSANSWTSADTIGYKILDMARPLPELISLRVRLDDLNDLEGKTLIPSLTSLKLRLSFSNVADWMKMLPPGLTLCRVSYPNNNFRVENLDWRALPQDLLDFSLAMAGPLSPDLAHLLPKRLTTLNLGNCTSEEALPFLPQTLTSLRGVLPATLSPKQTAMLPRSLKLADSQFLVASIPFLPPTLTRLRLSVTLEDMTFPPLPSTITTMDTTMLPSKLSEILPKGLKTLRVSKGKITPKAVELMPRSVTDLLTLGAQPLESDNCLEFMPPQALVLNLVALGPILDVITLRSQSSSWLGNRLKYLSLGECRVDPGWFSGLPASLDTLRLKVERVESNDMVDLSKACPNLTNLSLTLGSPQVIPNTTRHLLYPLSHSLRELDLRFNEFNKEDKLLSDTDLSRLPSGLDALTLPLNSGISPAALKILPKRLRRLSFGYMTPNWFKEPDE
jgi:hypothetical protein